MSEGPPRWKRLAPRDFFVSPSLTLSRKVFGVAPPQTLYHTRKPDSPISQRPILSVDIDTSPALTPLDPFSFFTMQGLGKKLRRPGTSDSSQALISRSGTSTPTEVYNNYRESLNSLIEMVDNVRLTA